MDTTEKKETWSWKDRKPNNILKILTTPDKDFFKWWCSLLRPLVSMTDRETDVIASFLKQRFELSKKTSDPSILDTLVMSEESKRKVMDECKITLQHFYVVMSTLRKKSVIKGNIINPRIIPNLRKDDNGYFQLLILIGESNLK